MSHKARFKPPHLTRLVVNHYEAVGKVRRAIAKAESGDEERLCQDTAVPCREHPCTRMVLLHGQWCYQCCGALVPQQQEH